MPRNLLLRFANDTIDETPQLASTLQSSAVAGMLELTGGWVWAGGCVVGG